MRVAIRFAHEFFVCDILTTVDANRRYSLDNGLAMLFTIRITHCFVKLSVHLVHLFLRGVDGIAVLTFAHGAIAVELRWISFDELMILHFVFRSYLNTTFTAADWNQITA